MAPGASAAASARVDAASTPNPLISTQSGSELQIILHPLVLLTISDYITRHTLRGQKSPIVGGLLGQQNGRDITIEHAFDCDMVPDQNAQDSAGYKLNTQHFGQKFEHMRMVHQDRHLDLVGWYTLLPSSGPAAETLSTQKVFQSYNESAVLLGFHPDHALDQSNGGKLPLTIYESIWEVKARTDQVDASEDKPMGDGGDGRPQLKYREVPYSVEVDETEMISMNYIAGTSGGSGGTNAPAGAKDDKPSRSIESNGKGKRRLVEKPSETEPPTASGDNLTSDEEEMIAFLTTKANATKMLQSRIRLIKTYLESLPPSALTGGNKPDDVNMDADHTSASITVLRQIQALISRLDLIVPSDKEAFEKELAQGANDASLIQLMDEIARSAVQARSTGKKFSIVETAKNNPRNNPGPGNYHGGTDFSNLGVGDIMI